MGHWWDGYPWRMIQTNLREIDMDHLDAKAYVEELKEFGATVVLLNASGIVASYDTALADHTKSAYLTGDSLKEIIDTCHASGIRVIARTDFSKVRYPVYEKHPDWAYLTSGGDIINYNGDVHVCLNGGYQQEYMFDIIRETLTTHDFDGIFCNMSGFQVTDYSGNYHGPCHCDGCREKFKAQYGGELPKRDNMADPAYHKYLQFKWACGKTHTAKLIEMVKSISPEIAINGLDYMRCESNTEIGRAKWPYSASSNSRVISGPERKRPSDNASVDFMGFRYRHTSVSPALMELRQWQNLAGSGSVSLYIMGTLGSHKDTSSFSVTKKVFDFHRQNEAFFSGLVSDAKVVVLRKAKWLPDDEVFGWIRALTESHIPFDEIMLDELTDLQQLDGKSLVVLGNMKCLPKKQAKVLDRFADTGGTVLATGETGLLDGNMEKREVPGLKCLGVRWVEDTRCNLMSSIFHIEDSERALFPHCVDTPYIAPGSDLVMVQVDPEAKGYLRLIPEHPFGPPERCYFTEQTQRPGITVFSFGRGRGLYIPWMIGSFYRKEGYQNTLNMMQDILFSLCGVEDIAPGLTPMVELNRYTRGENTVIQLVNNTGCFDNSYFPPVPVQNIQLRLKCVQATSVKTLNGGKANCWREGDELYIKLDELRHYEAIILS